MLGSPVELPKSQSVEGLPRGQFSATIGLGGEEQICARHVLVAAKRTIATILKGIVKPFLFIATRIFGLSRYIQSVVTER